MGGAALKFKKSTTTIHPPCKCNIQYRPKRDKVQTSNPPTTKKPKQPHIKKALGGGPLGFQHYCPYLSTS